MRSMSLLDPRELAGEADLLADGCLVDCEGTRSVGGGDASGVLLTLGVASVARLGLDAGGGRGDRGGDGDGDGDEAGSGTCPVAACFASEVNVVEALACVAIEESDGAGVGVTGSTPKAIAVTTAPAIVMIAKALAQTHQRRALAFFDVTSAVGKLRRSSGGRFTTGAGGPSGFARCFSM